MTYEYFLNVTIILNDIFHDLMKNVRILKMDIDSVFMDRQLLTMMHQVCLFLQVNEEILVDQD